MLTDYERRVIAEMEAALKADYRRMRFAAVLRSTLGPVVGFAAAAVAAVLAAGFVVAGLAMAVTL